VPTVGETIAGKYRVDRQIGAGGMGTVVAATHLTLGTPVALKFLSDAIKGSANSVERFTREAKACAALRSEHVCRVTDFGMHAEMPYIAMELLEGIDLARLIEGGMIDSGMAVDFILQACDGLAEAHAHGIVHRDLKPGNLFLTRRPDGTPLVKVLDFGVAKIPQSEDTSLTKTSSVIGSPGYMAPEQLRSSKTVDTRADIWALGVILYQLVSKRHPFHAEAVTEIAVKIAMDDPEPLTEAAAPLRAVIMRCLEKEPDRRFPDIASLAAALAPFRIHDRAAAIASAKLWLEAPWSRPLLPTTIGSSSTIGTSPTVAAAPPPGQLAFQTTHEVGHGAIEAKVKRGGSRVALFAVAGVLVAGGLTAFALTRGGGGAATPVDAAAVASAPPPVAAPSVDAAAPIVASPPPDAAVLATPPPDAAVLATPPPDAAVLAPPPVIADVKPRPKPPENRPKPPKPPAAGTAKPPTATPDKPKPPDAPVDPRTLAERTLSQATSTMGARGLTYEDLGNPGTQLRDEIARGRRAADWAAMREAAEKLSSLTLRFTVDSKFVAKKSARLTAQLRASRPSAELETRILQLQNDSEGYARNGNYAGANMTLNRAFTMLPLAPMPVPTAPPPPPDPY